MEWGSYLVVFLFEGNGIASDGWVGLVYREKQYSCWGRSGIVMNQYHGVCTV